MDNKEIAIGLETKLIKDFDSIKLDENNSKTMFCITAIKNDENGIIQVSQITQGAKIDIVKAIVFLLRNEENLDIQDIFEAVKESI